MEKLKSVFIVTRVMNITGGHGINDNINRLETYDGYNEKPFPAFETREDAEEFIKKVCKYHLPSITEVEIFRK